LRSAAQRIDAYNARMVSSLIDPKIAAVNTAAKANFAAHVTPYVAFQQLVHQYLDSEGALPVEYFNYNAYAGEIWHIDKHFSGAAAIAAGGDMVIRYTGMGCTDVRLKAIAAILGIIIP